MQFRLAELMSTGHPVYWISKAIRYVWVVIQCSVTCSIMIYQVTLTFITCRIWLKFSTFQLSVARQIYATAYNTHVKQLYTSNIQLHEVLNSLFPEVILSSYYCHYRPNCYITHINILVNTAWPTSFRSVIMLLKNQKNDITSAETNAAGTSNHQLTCLALSSSTQPFFP